VQQRGVALVGADLDEGPMAGRRLPEVPGYHSGSVPVLHSLRPFAVAMAGEGRFDPFKDARLGIDAYETIRRRTCALAHARLLIAYPQPCILPRLNSVANGGERDGDDESSARRPQGMLRPSTPDRRASRIVEPAGSSSQGENPMPLFPCRKCDCIEDTALCHYWSARLRQTSALCSACDPTIGKWHGEFPKESAQGWIRDRDGFLLDKRAVERWLGQPIDTFSRPSQERSEASDSVRAHVLALDAIPDDTNPSSD
jgi:hypothetical protein